MLVQSFNIYTKHLQCSSRFKSVISTPAYSIGPPDGVLWDFHIYTYACTNFGGSKFKILNFNIFGVFTKMNIFSGVKILWIFLRSSQYWTVFVVVGGGGFFYLFFIVVCCCGFLCCVVCCFFLCVFFVLFFMLFFVVVYLFIYFFLGGGGYIYAL